MEIVQKVQLSATLHQEVLEHYTWRSKNSQGSQINNLWAVVAKHFPAVMQNGDCTEKLCPPYSRCSGKQATAVK
jgi:hypothetical protein